MRELLRRASLVRIGGCFLEPRELSRRPLVSVVIPCYNYGRYLAQCVASVTEQQPGIDVQVIIVDDCSTDDSLDVAVALAAGDRRVQVIRHLKNRGHIQTYNDGLDAAEGEFVLLLSADDLATPGALTRAAEMLVANESVGFVYGNAIHFSDHLPPCRVTSKQWIVYSGRRWLDGRCRSGYNVVASPEVVMRTDIVRRTGGYRPDLPHSGDFEMWMRSAAVSDVGFLVDVDQAYYRHHGENMQTRSFDMGSANGQLTDLRQRWRSFQAVFEGSVEDPSWREAGLRRAGRTVATQALGHMNYAYARGFRGFPMAEFEDFARDVWPDLGRLRAGRALARRRRVGFMSLPMNPLWAPGAVQARFTERARRWRRREVGV